MAPDDRIHIRENASYQYEVSDGKKWLGTFQFFKDASEFAAKQTIAKEPKPECEYCHERHDQRVACPAYVAASTTLLQS